MYRLLDTTIYVDGRKDSPCGVFPARELESSLLKTVLPNLNC